MLSLSFPRRCRGTSRCARAPRQLPRRADDYLGGAANHKNGEAAVEGSRQPLHATHPNHRNPIRIFVFSGVWVVMLVVVSLWCRLSVSRPCGRWGSRRCAVWTLAAWRCLILHARSGAPAT